MAKLCCPYLHSFGHTQHPAAVTICPAWPVWYRVQTGAACPAFGRRYAMVLVCPAACDVQSVRVRWGLGSPPLGYMGSAGGGVVDTSRRKNSKKAFLLPTHPLFSAQNALPPIANLKKFPQKQKNPYKGSVFCAILALQALKRRNL